MKRTSKPTVAAHKSIVNEIHTFIGTKCLSARTAEKMQHMSVLYVQCPLHVSLQFYVKYTLKLSVTK